MGHSSTPSIATTAIDYTPDVLASSVDTTSAIPGTRRKSEDTAKGENNNEREEKTTSSPGSIRKDGDGVKGRGQEGDNGFPVLSQFRSIMLVFVMSSAMILNIVNVQAVTIALEKIGTELNIEISNYQWLASAYSLAFGSFLLLFGRLSDIYGHKKTFILGQIWFCIWSIGVGFAPNEIGIDIMRALQGSGAAASIPAALGILGATFPPGQKKSNAFATFSAGAPIGASLGGVLGGVLTQYASWREIFFVSAGLALLLAFGAWVYVPADPILERDQNREVDWIGAALITSGLSLLVFGLADGEGAPDGWKTPYIPVLFTLGCLLTVAFWFYERHLEYHTTSIPLMRVSLWNKGKFVYVQIIGLFGWSAFTSFMFFATLYFQDYQLLSPILTTIRFLPAAITGIIINAIAALAASRIPAQYLIVFGAAGTMMAPLLFAVRTEGTPYWQFEFPAMILAVFGVDFIFSLCIMYISKVANADEQALAGGIFNMTTQIGTAIGLTVMTIIQSRVTAKEVQRLGGVYSANARNIPLDATLKGLQAAFYGCAGFALVAVIVCIFFLNGIGRVGERTVKMIPAKSVQVIPDVDEEGEMTSNEPENLG